MALNVASSVKLEGSNTQSLALRDLVNFNSVPIPFEFVVLGVKVLYQDNFDMRYLDSLIVGNTIIFDGEFLTTFKDHVSSQSIPPICDFNRRKNV